MRIPDYNRMREALAFYESENISKPDLYEALLLGVTGYRDYEDEEVITLFVDIWGANQIPKKKPEKPTRKKNTTKNQCTECGYLICVCKPVVN